MGLFTKKKKPVASTPKATTKPAAKTKTAKGDDAADTLERMRRKQAENPDSCPFC